MGINADATGIVVANPVASASTTTTPTAIAAATWNNANNDI